MRTKQDELPREPNMRKSADRKIVVVLVVFVFVIVIVSDIPWRAHHTDHFDYDYRSAFASLNTNTKRRNVRTATG
jgi:hypothetical protein